MELDESSKEQLAGAAFSATIEEDCIYLKIADELESGNMEKGLWTRLFAECDGDENRTKVLYIKMRAERLIAGEQARLEQLAHEEAIDAERTKRLRLERLSLRDRLGSKNITQDLSGRIAELSETYSAVNLFMEVRLNHTEDVLALLNQEPLLVAVTNSEGDTALHIALREKCSSMAQVLLECGAPVDAPNIYGVTPIEMASKSNNPELVRLVSSVSKSGSHDSLCYAKGAESDALMSADFGPRDGGSVEAFDDDPYGFKRRAAKARERGFENDEVKTGASQDLIKAMRSERFELANIDLDRIDELSRSDAVVQAVIAMQDKNENRFFEIISNERFLVEAYNLNGDTLLHLAIRSNLPEFVDILIRFGASKLRNNLDGESPLSLASKAHNPKILDIMASR